MIGSIERDTQGERLQHLANSLAAKLLAYLEQFDLPTVKALLAERSLEELLESATRGETTNTMEASHER